MSDVQKIKLSEKLDMVTEYWNPKIIGDLNDSYIKVAKFKGEFVWHKHEHEDELFWVVEGRLLIKLRDKDIHLNPDELVIIPKGVEHFPIAEEEVQVVLIELKSTLNTGEVTNELTKEKLERI